MKFLKYVGLGVLSLALVIGLLLVRNQQNGKSLINGQQAPALELPDISGENRSLSELQGNIILIDFWASWCQPCRKNNPKLVRLYRQYKDERLSNGGQFKVYAVSLDSKREAWIKAIEEDGLFWDIHVSQLNGWSSDVVGAYGIQSIPASFLVDTNGVIIGKDLKQKDLEQILSKRFGKDRKG